MPAKLSPELSKILKQGIEAACRGQADEARQHLKAVLKQNPDHIPALLWLAFVQPTPAETIRVLERVLALDPHNERAQAGIRWAQSQLEQAGGSSASQPEPADTPPSGAPANLRQQILSKKTRQQARKGVLAHRARRQLRPLLLLLLATGILALAGLTGLLLLPPDTLAAWIPVRAEVVPPPPLAVGPDLPTAEAPAAAAGLAILSDTLSLPPPTAVPAVPAPPEPAPSPVLPALNLPPQPPLSDLSLLVGPALPAPTPTAVPTATPTPPLAHQPAYPGEKWIEVNLTTQQVTAWEGDKPVFHFIASTGLPQTPTVTGEYRIYWKLKATLMTGPGYYLPDVPYTMYFYRGYALHGTYWHNNFGQPMSHGCVNLETENARKLFEWADPVVPEGENQVVATADNPGTLVVIHY